MGNYRTIGLLGGSFNPPHAGHVYISGEAKKRLKLDQVWWLVSPQNPLKEKAANYKKRLVACTEITAKKSFIHISDFEQKNGTQYTIDTIQALKQKHPHTTFIWLMGADNLAGFHLWKEWREIAKLVPIVVLDRAPYSVKSLQSPAGLALHKYRVKPSQIGTKTPAFAFIRMKLSPLSSSALRSAVILP